MVAFVVDPLTQTVTPVELNREDVLATAREQIGAVQIVCLADATNRFVVWIDNLGMLKPERAFWSFKDVPRRYAGRALITGLAEDGFPADLEPTGQEAKLAAIINWHPSDTLLRIDERIIIVDDPEGRPLPMVLHEPMWKDVIAPPAPPAEEPQPSLGWSVYEREDGTYRAVQYRLRGEDLEPTAMFTAPNLDALREQLPPGLTRVEPAEEDPADLVESWA